MASQRVAKKRILRGGSSQTQQDLPVTSLSLLSTNLTEVFEKFRNRKVVKQHYVTMKTLEVEHLDFISDLIAFQGLQPFFACSNKYNEDCVRLFYAGIKEKFEGSVFRYRSDNKFFMVTSHVWKDLLYLDPEEANAIRFSDSTDIVGYDFKTTLNFMLKTPYAEHIVNSALFPPNVTTGSLAPFDWIL